MTDTIPRVDANVARQQIEVILQAWGMTRSAFTLSADILIDSDLKGIDSHGISMLMFYDQLFRAGQIDMQASAGIVRETATTALVDGQASMGHPTSHVAMELAIQKALASDIGAVSVFNSQHFGAAGYYAEMAAKRGLMAIVACSTRLATVVPTYGAQPMLGTNPFAFAVPAGRHPAVIVDMSTSVVASNKVKVYALQGKPLPPGWALDANGAPLTDSAEAFRLLFGRLGGGLAPLGGDGMVLGGHKGYGLGLMAQLFGSTLAGGSFSPVRNKTQASNEPDNIGHFFLAMNPAAFRPFDEYQSDVDDVIDALRSCTPADPARPVLIPGDPERLARDERSKLGIPMPDSLRSQLHEVATRAGAPFLLGDRGCA